MKLKLVHVTVVGAFLGLASCDSSGNPADDLTAAVNSFGRVFAAAFFADISTDVLVDPAANDLKVDPTANPIDI